MQRIHPRNLFPQNTGSHVLAPVLVLDSVIGAGSSSARDIVLFNNDVPHDMSILGVEWITTTQGAADSTAQLRSATGGGGSPLSGPIPLDAAGRARENAGGSLGANTTVSRGGSLVFRMSNGTAAGRLFVYYRRSV